MSKLIDKKSVVSDTIHGQIAISSFEKDIIATTLFNRLHGIHQNSTAYMTFPTNRTKRVEHSFGTMYLCGNMFVNSLCNASTPDNKQFFDMAQEKISDIISSIKVSEQYNSKLGNIIQKVPKAYGNLSINGGIYARMMPGNLESVNHKPFIIFFEAIRVSALLHDVGHPPFSHITEFALKNVYERVLNENIDNETVANFKEIMQNYCQDDMELHEQMSNRIAKTLFEDAVDDINEKQAKDDDVYGQQVFRLIVKEIVLNILKEKDPFYEDLHNIISGTLDGDRLDYVSRDVINSGFSAGIIEYERMLSSMKLISTTVDNKCRFLFCPCTSVVNTIEDFLLRRWNLYCNIIYHHHVVKTDYLLQMSIEQIAYDYLKNNEDRPDTRENGRNVNESGNCEDQTYHYTLPYNISGLWNAIKQQPSPLEWGYAINQWDDAWLISVLKKIYFEKIIEESTLLNKMLTELLTNKRRFVSLIKRKEEFWVIDKAVADGIVKQEEKIRDVIRYLEKKELHDKVKKIIIDEFISTINTLLEKSKNYCENDSLTGNEGFLLVYIRNKVLSFRSDQDILQNIVSEIIDERYRDAGFSVFKTLKTGTKKTLYMYKKYSDALGDDLVYLNNVSDISKVLENNANFNPFFFIYLDIEKTSAANFDFKTERERIGGCIAEKVSQFIIDFISNI